MHDAMTAEVAGRVGVWLRKEWPANTAKLAARELGTEERTVKGWLAGKLPANRFIIMMSNRWGWRFNAFVFEPACGREAEAMRLAAELVEHHKRLGELSQAWQSANGGAGGSA